LLKSPFRTEHNYQSAEVIAELPANATNYEIINSDPCKDYYYYTIYGFTEDRLMAISSTLPNSQFGFPSPFFLLFPGENIVVNNSVLNFDWEDSIHPSPLENIMYMFYLYETLNLSNPLIVENLTSSNYTFFNLSSLNYFWEVKAIDSCGFETFGSTLKNIALDDNGGVVSTSGGSVPYPERINDGSHGNGTSFNEGFYSLMIEFPEIDNVNRIKLDYSFSQSSANIPPTHSIYYYNNETFLGKNMGISDGIHKTKDISFNPVNSSLLKIIFSVAANYSSYSGSIYELEVSRTTGHRSQYLKSLAIDQWHE